MEDTEDYIGSGVPGPSGVYTTPAEETAYYRRASALSHAIAFAAGRELSGPGVIEIASAFDKFLGGENANA